MQGAGSRPVRIAGAIGRTPFRLEHHAHNPGCVRPRVGQVAQALCGARYSAAEFAGGPPCALDEASVFYCIMAKALAAAARNEHRARALAQAGACRTGVYHRTVCDGDADGPWSDKVPGAEQKDHHIAARSIQHFERGKKGVAILYVVVGEDSRNRRFPLSSGRGRRRYTRSSW